MGRHRAPSNAAYTATDLIADIAEEDAQLAAAKEPTPAPEVELVMEDDHPTGRLGVVPLHVHYVSDAEARARTESLASSTVPIRATRPVDPPTTLMPALPPVFPTALEAPQGVQEPSGGPGQARGATRSPEPSTDVSVTLERVTRHLRSVS